MPARSVAGFRRRPPNKSSCVAVGDSARQQAADLRLEVAMLVRLHEMRAVLAEVAGGLRRPAHARTQQHLEVGPPAADPLRQAEAAVLALGVEIDEYDVGL